MKILLINKYFYLRGGAEKSFFDSAALLKKKGHSVLFFSMVHPENYASPYARHFVSHINFEAGSSLKTKWKASTRILYSWEARTKLKALLQEEMPDIVHLHNIHHQISPSILHTLRNFSLPVVQTLHDYKIVCPVYTLLSGGQICEQCRNKHFYRCFRQRCSKDSYAKSLLSALEMYLHHSVMRIYRWIDVFISPSRFLKDKVEEMGFKGDIVHIPNAINIDDYPESDNEVHNSIIYFGRLSKEKGIFTLLKALKALPVDCKIFGDGPEKANLEKAIQNEKIRNVTLCGYVAQKQLQEEIKKAMFVILPSEWHENNPLAIIESFALGKPVIGSRIGGIPELIKDHQTGLTFEPGNADDLRKNVLYLLNNSEKIVSLGRNARSLIEQEYNQEKQSQELMKTYQLAMEKHQ